MNIIDKAFNEEWISLEELRTFSEKYELSCSHADTVLHSMEREVARIERILEEESNSLSEDEKVHYAERMRRYFEILSPMLSIVSSSRGIVTFDGDKRYDYERQDKIDEKKGYEKILEELFTKYGGHGTERLILLENKDKRGSTW